MQSRPPGATVSRPSTSSTRRDARRLAVGAPKHQPTVGRLGGRRLDDEHRARSVVLASTTNIVPARSCSRSRSDCKAMNIRAVNAMNSEPNTTRRHRRHIRISAIRHPNQSNPANASRFGIKPCRHRVAAGRRGARPARSDAPSAAQSMRPDRRRGVGPSVAPPWYALATYWGDTITVRQAAEHGRLR